jgi:hypothetical protein
MPSPFPGMDPYIQGQTWLNFHNSFCIALRNQLVPQVLPKYVVDVEERLVVEIEDDASASYLADVSLKESETNSREPALAASTTATLEPKILTYRWIEPAREVILQVLDRKSRRVVTIIEVLSPWNKSATGIAEYLAKREDLLDAGVNLVEIDLVRGGRRLPTVERLPPADFFAFVSRSDEKKRLLTYAWSLRDPLPSFPVPLNDGDQAEVRLQEAFDRVYDEAGFRHLISYHERTKPPLSNAVMEWVGERLRTAGIEPPHA